MNKEEKLLYLRKQWTLYPEKRKTIELQARVLLSTVSKATEQEERLLKAARDTLL